MARPPQFKKDEVAIPEPPKEQATKEPEQVIVQVTEQQMIINNLQAILKNQVQTYQEILKGFKQLGVDLEKQD